MIARSYEYDRAWDEHARDRPYVSLCIYVVGDLDREGHAELLARIHDTVL